MPDQAEAALDEARQALQRLADELNRDPTQIDAWAKAASILTEFGECDQAIGAYRRILAIEPRHYAARLGMASMLIEQGALAEAELVVAEIVAAHSHSAEVWFLLATLRQKRVRDAEASLALRKAMELRPSPVYHSNLLQIMQYAEDISPRELLAAHRDWSQAYAGPSSTSAPAELPKRDRATPLRIGFVSSDFGRHPIGFLTLTPLECLDRTLATVICYYDRLPEDSHTARFKAAADSWRVCAGWSDERLAAQIRADEIDILFDLMGHTGARLLCFARRPAPIQVTWAGYVGTTGLAAMDFLLADRFHVRPGEEKFYSEHVLRMPNDYVCYGGLPNDAPEIAPLPALATGRITFGCFNNAAKFSQRILDAWAEILHRVPSAQLLLKTHSLDQSELQDRLHVHFATRGIPPQRVLLEGRSPHWELLNAYSRVDLALDTQPYSGGLTTCEALWMGVPVITFPGDTFAGRHSVSHLTNAGCEQFVAPDRPGYIDLAVQWAGRLENLAAIRAQLRDQMRRSPLCDARKFAADFLAILQQVS